MPKRPDSGLNDCERVPLIVAPEEKGMKLLRFLERRLVEIPARNILHKWIRTGQVRLNGGRAKPFASLEPGDSVRLPPFALPRHVAEASEAESRPDQSASPRSSAGSSGLLGPGLRVVDETRDLIVLAKSSGLPCQPGSGHEDSVSRRLARAYADCPFVPAPAHRLDRRTSGLLLAAKTLEAQQRLHAMLRRGDIAKEYLAWVAGDWRPDGPSLLLDSLVRRQDRKGKERVAALPGGKTLPLPLSGAVAEAALASAADAPGLFALAAVAPVLKIAGRSAGIAVPVVTLLLLRLFTGRKHQLRAQLASRGYPVAGDGRHGGPEFSPMLLHAHALRLLEPSAQEPHAPQPLFSEYSAPPEWPEALSPDADALASAGCLLARAAREPERIFRQTARIPTE